MHGYFSFFFLPIGLAIPVSSTDATTSLLRLYQSSGQVDRWSRLSFQMAKGKVMPLSFCVFMVDLNISFIYYDLKINLCRYIKDFR